MPNQPKTPMFSFRATQDLQDKARRKAKMEGTTLSEVMRIRLEAYVYDEPWPGTHTPDE